MRRSKRLLYVVSTMFCLTSLLSAQSREPGTHMHIQVDFARFRGDDSNAYVEIYYGVPQNSLTYVSNGTGFKAGVELAVTVSTKDSLYFADRFMMPHAAKDSGANNMNLISRSGMMLGNGEYSLKVVGKDVNNATRRDSATMHLSVSVPPTDKVALSDIEFASSIKKGQQGAPFYKNTLEVIPNVEGLYGNGNVCYYYAEAYNLLGSDKSDLSLKTTIFNAIGKEVITRERPRKRSGESTVLVDNIDVSDLKGGTYTLMLTLTDSGKKPLTSSGKKFFVVNSQLGLDSSLLKLDPAISLAVYSSMSEAELDKEFKMARWEARDDERDQYAKLNGEIPKRKFMTDFWAKRPPGLRDLYFQRVKTANENFGVLGRDGYRSDRGRVHIIYGPPDDIERHPNESGSKPYEIWSYNTIQGGVIFVFLLRQNGGDYELVHSTHRNELHDENWARNSLLN